MAKLRHTVNLGSSHRFCNHRACPQLPEAILLIENKLQRWRKSISGTTNKVQKGEFVVCSRNRKKAGVTGAECARKEASEMGENTCEDRRVGCSKPCGLWERVWNCPAAMREALE